MRCRFRGRLSGIWEWPEGPSTGRGRSHCPEDGYWTVVLRNGNKYIAADPRILLSLRQKPQKVGVFVDYKEGLVSFYDVEAKSHIFSFTGFSFTEKLYPVLCPCLNDEGKNSVPLIITPVTQ